MHCALLLGHYPNYPMVHGANAQGSSRGVAQGVRANGVRVRGMVIIPGWRTMSTTTKAHVLSSRSMRSWCLLLAGIATLGGIGATGGQGLSMTSANRGKQQHPPVHQLMRGWACGIWPCNRPCGHAGMGRGLHFELGRWCT